MRTRIILALLMAVALVSVPYVFATGARAQMDGTSFKSIDSGGNTLVEMDGTGIHMTSDATDPPGNTRTYGFSPKDGSGLSYYYDPPFHTPRVDLKSPAGNMLLQASNVLYIDAAGGTGIWNGTGWSTGSTLSCYAGEYLEHPIVTKGIVTSGNCTSPAPVPATELAALRSQLSALQAKVAALEALAGQVGGKQ